MLTVTILLIGQPPVTGPFSLACAASLLHSSMVTGKIYDNGTYIGNSPHILRYKKMLKESRVKMVNERLDMLEIYICLNE